MSSDTASFSGLEGVVVTSANLQTAADSDEIDDLKSKNTKESSDAVEGESHDDAAAANLEFDDDLPTFIMKFKVWMHSNQLSQRVVAPVLNLSQSHLCDLLNAKKQGYSWSKIAAAGRKPYYRMQKIMEDEMILKALCLNRYAFREQSRVKKRKIRPYNQNRLTLSIHQKKILENAYMLAKYPSATEYHRLATKLGITFRQVRTWFNNRRKLRCCPPSIQNSSDQDEDSFIEPMPESVSRGIIVEEFRVENGEVVAVDPYVSTDREAIMALPQEATEKMHNETVGENATLTSYLNSLEEKQLERTKQGVDQENDESSASSLEGVEVEIDLDSQEMKTHPEIKRDCQLEEVVKKGGHVEVRNGVVVLSKPFPSLNGDMFTSSKGQDEGARTVHVSPPLLLNSHQSAAEGSVSDGDSSPSVETSNRTGNKTVPDDAVMVRTGCQQSSASSDKKRAYKLTDTQLKFLQLTLEMHGNPSVEILDALSVLTWLEKDEIREWFKTNLEEKTL